MTAEDPYKTPFDSDDHAVETSTDLVSEEQFSDQVVFDDQNGSDESPQLQDPDLSDAKQAWDNPAAAEPRGDELAITEPSIEAEDEQLAELAQPFVGRWNTLISTTNWQKGEIIQQWRLALIASGAPANEHSDEVWARRVGGVTAPHVGRLRRVYDRFGSTYATYEGLYWSHFLAALDWDDAPLWLEGAVQENWSVSAMRNKRWEATGAVESQRPTGSQIIEVDTDEDVVLPAQGGGRTREYDDEPSGVATGPLHEEPDFGDAEEFNSLDAAGSGASAGLKEIDEDEPQSNNGPFAELPELPNDLADAIEALKLAVLRHKSAKWDQTNVETVQRYLDAVGTLMQS